MSKLPSEATQIRTLNREIKRLHQQAWEASRARDAHAIRAAQAEQEATEWKERFDRLLRAARITVGEEKKPT